MSTGALCLALVVSACAPEPALEPIDSSTDELQIEGTVENFFELLRDGDARAAALMTDLEIDIDAEEALLLDDGVYSKVGSRPELVDVGDVSVSGDEARAEVRYLVDEVTREETLELVRIPKQGTVPEHHLIRLSPEAAGADMTGAELLPDDTVYRINGVDVTAAIRAAVEQAPRTGGTPRVLAFGGDYPIEVTVPGGGGFTDTFLLEVPMFAGGDSSGGGFVDFVREHGF
ncbi:hypothetical protein ACIPV2_07705 [Microbacterium sp. NPDC089987]|uniref:hypothetical protein n=1 Tax=Microbacterium sp. NPDC089987 TaxID=3364202 RepID=UPI00382008AF